MANEHNHDRTEHSTTTVKNPNRPEASYNFGHFKWKMKTTPPPNFNDEKNGGLQLAHGFIIHFGGRGGGGVLILHYILVQDCSWLF